MQECRTDLGSAQIFLMEGWKKIFLMKLFLQVLRFNLVEQKHDIMLD